MNQIEQNLTPYKTMGDNQVDYSEMYRTQETKQLNKRLRKTRNVLLICAAVLIVGALIFWVMPETAFTTKNFFLYLGLASSIVLLSIYSNKQPYFSMLSALIICIGFWSIEIVTKNIDDMLVIGGIHKLFILSLLVSCFHSSREAELIRKELRFS
jgi:hypothetical protein